MSSIEEKRVYAEKSGEATLRLASDVGVVRVSVSADSIGEFGIEQRCHARDLADCGGLAVATDEDVLLDGEPTGFGPAVAVGGEGEPIAAGPEGRAARYADDEWEELGRVEGVRAADGDLLAAADGIYRAADGLAHVGLEGAADVSTPGVPLAATDEGLYRLGNGWMREAEGEFDRVAADRDSPPGELARACALGGGALYVYDGEWRERDVPEPLAAAAIGEAIYGATVDGTLYVDAGDGWRSQALGVPGVGAMLVD